MNERGSPHIAEMERGIPWPISKLHANTISIRSTLVPIRTVGSDSAERTLSRLGVRSFVYEYNDCSNLYCKKLPVWQMIILLKLDEEISPYCTLLLPKYFL